ncbi:MAG: GNAT family N-acetyltransferase [Gammaproteobacteria bacterium]
MATLRVQALDKAHDVAGFDCGNPDLNQWFRTTARQHQKNGTSRTFVLVEGEHPEIILGFFTMAIRDVTLKEDLPASMAKKLPARVPGYTLARLAVSVSAQKRGLGEYLLFEAMERSYRAAKLVGGFALFVDAKEGAADFYKRYGFVPFPDDPDTLVIPIASMPAFPD